MPPLVFNFWWCLYFLVVLAYHILMSVTGVRLNINAQSQLESVPFELPELADNDVRIQVQFNAIGRNDLLLLDGAHSQDYFGVGAVGTVVAVGKAVGVRKVGEAVGVFHDSINRGGFKTGFSTLLQVDASQVVFLPTSIPLPFASSLLTDGIVAFNALERIPKGSPIAVLGTGSLAYLTVQFAKKVFGLHVTVFAVGEGATAEGVAETLGADAADVYSVAITKKYTEKFDALVVTEVLSAAEAKPLQDMAMRTGKLFFTTQFQYTPSIVFFDLIVCQREFVGVKRGSMAQYVKMLHAAAFHGVSPRVEVVAASDFQGAFGRARLAGGRQVVLEY